MCRGLGHAIMLAVYYRLAKTHVPSSASSRTLSSGTL
jgi:hypothetical protein